MDPVMSLLIFIMIMNFVLLFLEFRRARDFHYPSRQFSDLLPDKMHMKPYNKRPARAKPIVNDDEKQWMKEHDLK